MPTPSTSGRIGHDPVRNAVGTMNKRRYGVLVLALLGVGLTVLVLAQSAFALDPRAKACGAGPWPTLATFEVPQARLVRQHLPHMKGAPELNTDSPAYVVLFDGPIDLPVVGFGNSVKPTRQTGVI